MYACVCVCVCLCVCVCVCGCACCVVPLARLALEFSNGKQVDGLRLVVNSLELLMTYRASPRCWKVMTREAISVLLWKVMPVKV